MSAIEWILLGLALFIATPFFFFMLYAFLNLFSLFAFDKTVAEFYHYLRYVRFPPSHGDVEDFDLYPTGDPKMNRALFETGRTHKILNLDNYNGSPYYRINTFHRGLFIELAVPKRMLKPFIPVIMNNQKKKLALRMRYDPMTFQVYEVQHLIHKSKGEPTIEDK